MDNPAVGPRRTRRPELAILVIAALASPAAAEDGSLVWKTITTPHFWVHYPEPLGRQAQRLARRAERAHEILAPVMRYAPAGRTHVVLRDDQDSANGSAQVIPYNLINAYLVSPESFSLLHDFDDWLFDLILHEYVHILHLDTTHGWTRVYNAIFGKTFVLNAVQPRWFIEGLATYHESAQTSSGRVRSSLADAYLRAATLEGAAPRIDQLSSERRAFPRGNIAYLWGGRFLDYVARRHGAGKLADISHDYGGALLPYGLNRSARRATGKSYIELWDEFLADLSRRHEAQAAEVRARGETRTRRLTVLGESLRYPRFSRDGKRILFYHSDGRSHAAIRAVAREGGPVSDVFETTSDTPPSPGLSGDIVVERGGPWRTFYSYTDLFRYDATADDLVRLTEGVRAREPDVSPDGRRIACSVIRAGSSGLALVPISGGRPQMLIAPEDERQVYTPSWSPDGRWIAYSGWTDGGYRDLFLYHLQSGTTRRLTHDRALDMDPRFAPDGRKLYFSSDRSGIYNIYALDLASGRLRQVTDVVSGAWQPAVSPDSRTLAFVGLSSIGFDLHVMGLDPDRFGEPLAQDAARPEPPRISSAERYPVRPYEPIRDLYPRRLEIDFFAFRSQPSFLQLRAAAVDPVGRHRAAAAVQHGFETSETAIAGAYVYNRFWPTMGLSASHDVGRRGGFVLDGRNLVYREDRTRARASATLPLLRVSEHAVTMSLAYTYEVFENADAGRYEPDPNDVVPRFPETGTLAGAAASLSYRASRGYAHSISAEQGRNMTLRVAVDHESLGGDYHETAVDCAWEEFTKNPWLDGHVLTLRLAGGLSRGNLRRRGTFSIGGFAEQDIVQSLVDLRFVGGARLRGYPPGIASGDEFVLLNTEYRMPLGEVARGILTLPLYLQNVHMAAFADWGNAFSGPIEPGDFKLGVGGELRTQIALGYVLPVVVRLGYAHGASEGGEDEIYVILGGGF